MGRCTERGVTLLELLVAMTLLAVALLGLAASVPLSMYGVTLGGYQTTATLLAEQAIEMAKGTTYGNLPLVATGGEVCDPDAGTGTFEDLATADPPFPGFSRCVSVQTGTPTATSSTVTVVVRFAGVGGEVVNARVVTVIAQ